MSLKVNNEPQPDAAVVRDSFELQEDTFALRLQIDADAVSNALEKMRIPAGDVGLVIVATGKCLKATEVVFRAPVMETELPDEVALSRTAHPLIFGDSSGFTVRAYVVLERDLQVRPLTPYLAGTWLAAREFSVSVRRDVLSGLRPQRLTDEVRRGLKLPAGTKTYLHIVGDSILESTGLAETVAFYIDASLFDRLYANQSSAVAEAFQIDFVIEILMGILSEVARDSDALGLGGSEDSVAGSHHEIVALTREVAERLDLTPSELFQTLRKDYPRVKAGLQAALNSSKLAQRAIGTMDK